MSIPSHVLVGPYLYKVTVEERQSSGDDLFGECDVHTQTVYLSPGQARDSMADSLLHEVLHAIWAASGLHDGRYNEEQCVRGITTWLLLVLRDNPELVTYLTETDHTVREIAAELGKAATMIVKLQEETAQGEINGASLE